MTMTTATGEPRLRELRIPVSEVYAAPNGWRFVRTRLVAAGFALARTKPSGEPVLAGKESTVTLEGGALVYRQRDP